MGTEGNGEIQNTLGGGVDFRGFILGGDQIQKIYIYIHIHISEKV